MVWDSTTVDDLRATVADCQMQVVIVDSCGNREHKWAIGASIKWPWTELKLMILMGEQFLEKMPIARKEQEHWQIKMERGEFALCRHGTILSNWYFTERLSDEDFFGNWQLLSKIFSWFRIEIKINKRPKNLTCCVAEVDIVWRLLCKMTLILVSTFEFVCIYINKMIWFLKYFGIDIFTWMKTGPEVSLEACPLWTKRKAKSRRLIPPPSWPPPPPPSWRGALPAALPPAPIMKLLTTPRLTCGRHWDKILKTMSHYHKIKTSLLRMITTKCYANAR